MKFGFFKIARASSFLLHRLRTRSRGILRSSLLFSPQKAFYCTGLAAGAAFMTTMPLFDAFPLSIDAKSNSVEEALVQADSLFEKGQDSVLELYNILFEANKTFPGKAEILWRLARASRLVSKDSRVGKEEQKTHAYSSLDYANLAVEVDPNNWAAHKWKAISISLIGDYEGIKVKISNAYKIKEEFEKALELNPKDATTRHLLGIWCLTFADMTWVERKIASTIFATPPSSTYEEALSHFEEAERLDPGFYKKNAVSLSKTYARLNNLPKAKFWKEKALAMPIRNLDDEEAHEEAKGIKV